MPSLSHRQGADSGFRGESASLNVMTERASDVLEQALKLSTEERARLAAELLASVDGEADADAASAWAAEIDARIARVQASGPTGDDWTIVRDRLAQGLRRK